MLLDRPAVFLASAGPPQGSESPLGGQRASASVGAVFLASASPRRQDLLRQVGVDFTLLAPGPDEDSEALEVVLPGELPADYVLRVARLKAQAARERLLRRHPGAPSDSSCVLCADTTVALDEQIFGKPDDTLDAARILSALSGKTHRVLTAVCVLRGDALFDAVQTSQVRFAALTAQDIADYVATGEPLGKAGAYAMQGRAAAFIEQISGSPSGIIGLPLFETLRLLRAAGWRHAAPNPTLATFPSP
ncbi:Maf-like protein YhdE [mine drainage metagenome]|uniref:Maf-like protein YhdE n=1 Tax=mine drainage metagenome TaxID=410659 RepID=A0A1J5PRJ3_9ZZZZ